MKVNILDKDLEELINNGKNNKYKKYSKDKKFLEGLARVLKIMQTVKNPEGLRPYSFLHYEKLANNVNVSSVRIVNGRAERLLFKEINDGIEITIIELNTDHYGNKK
jgi:plasmid maintenance system killer protein